MWGDFQYISAVFKRFKNELVKYIIAGSIESYNLNSNMVNVTVKPFITLPPLNVKALH